MPRMVALSGSKAVTLGTLCVGDAYGAYTVWLPRLFRLYPSNVPPPTYLVWLADC